MALGRLGAHRHTFTIIWSSAKVVRRWLKEMRGNGVAELPLELNEVPRSVLGRVWAALSGLKDGVRVRVRVVGVVEECRKAICGPPELFLRRHRLVHPHLPRMTWELYAQRYVDPRCAWNAGGTERGVSNKLAGLSSRVMKKGGREGGRKGGRKGGREEGSEGARERGKDRRSEPFAPNLSLL
jgi:hypothetical protein